MAAPLRCRTPAAAKSTLADGLINTPIQRKLSSSPAFGSMYEYDPVALLGSKLSLEGQQAVSYEGGMLPLMPSMPRSSTPPADSQKRLRDIWPSTPLPVRRHLANAVIRPDDVKAHSELYNNAASVHSPARSTTTTSSVADTTFYEDAPSSPRRFLTGNKAPSSPSGQHGRSASFFEDLTSFQASAARRNVLRISPPEATSDPNTFVAGDDSGTAFSSLGESSHSLLTTEPARRSAGALDDTVRQSSEIGAQVKDLSSHNEGHFTDDAQFQARRSDFSDAFSPQHSQPSQEAQQLRAELKASYLDNHRLAQRCNELAEKVMLLTQQISQVTRVSCINGTSHLVAHEVPAGPTDSQKQPTSLEGLPFQTSLVESMREQLQSMLLNGSSAVGDQAQRQPVTPGRPISPSTIAQRDFREAGETIAKPVQFRTNSTEGSCSFPVDPSYRPSYLNASANPLLPTQRGHYPPRNSPLGEDNSLPLDLSAYPFGSRRINLPATVSQSVSSPSAAYSHQYPKKTPANANATSARTGNTSPGALVAKALTGRTQEASIMLQQQLKSGSSDAQRKVIDAISPHVVKLSEDKHGNFLVQRAIGVDATIAWRLKGFFAQLALSQYGCHVVQRALDEGEDLKLCIVEELMRCDLVMTLTSRNSVHVWAKVLEIKWSDPAFHRSLMSAINAAMAGRWASIAMQETGSIVVQNLFESTNPVGKAACIEEILQQLDQCASNQWGVWVVQHIIEHGSAADRSITFAKLVVKAHPLSLSQYGHKAIMTALKTKDPTFTRSYLDQLCDTGSSDSGGSGAEDQTGKEAASTAGSRRPMLVDVATTSQGLQIITQLLTTIDREDRERVIKAVRKNSVFLKGSKTGLKIHQMCERARAYSGY